VQVRDAETVVLPLIGIRMPMDLAHGAWLTLNIEVIGAVMTVEIRYGFFMNWMGHQKGEGYEYHIIAVALAFLIFVRSAGAVSIDHLVSSRDSSRNG
jgi:uncharacterized membrane protein YphA (DoxX/SURF4 family)